MSGVNHESLRVPAPRGECPLDPPPAYERLRQERPVSQVTLWDGRPAWLVTRHADVRAVLGDPRFSADAARRGFPLVSRAAAAIPMDQRTFIRMDPPEHDRQRRMLTGQFTVRQIERFRPGVQRIADDFTDRLLARTPPADLVSEFALPIPSMVICLLLGVPYEDHDFFQQRGATLLNQAAAPEEVRQASDDLTDYLGELVQVKAAEPGDDLLSRLVAEHEAGGRLDRPTVVAMARLLLIAGHETTANMIALSVLTLLREPDQLAALRDDPSLIGGAVEELLRYLSIVQTGLPRLALEDVEVGGRLVRAGEGVLCSLPTANRDEDSFPGGGELDVHRNPRRHVAFGFGVHQCLGQPLARMELQVTLATLLRRVPGLRLAIPFDEIEFRHTRLIYGVHRLPVAWEV